MTLLGHSPITSDDVRREDRSDFESAIEPVVDFDIDTTELDEQADEIRQRLRRVAQQHQRMAEDR